MTTEELLTLLQQKKAEPLTPILPYGSAQVPQTPLSDILKAFFLNKDVGYPKPQPPRQLPPYMTGFRG